MSLRRASVFLLAALLTGCAAGRREKPGAGDPASIYLAQTLAWAAAEEPQQPQTTPPAPSAMPYFANDTTTAAQAAVPAEVAAAVFGITTATAAAELAEARSTPTLRARLARRVDWPTLRAAIAVHNPAVQAAAASWQATLRQYAQSEYLEGLTAQYRAFTRTLEVGPGSQLNRQMAQTFAPMPGSVALRGEMVRQMAAMARAEWEMTLRDQLVAGGEAFHEYQYLGRALGVAEENVALVRELLGAIEEAYRTGAAPQADVLRLQTELARQQNELRAMQAMQDAQRARVAALLGRLAEAPLGPAAPADFAPFSATAAELTSRALSLRQELRIATARAAQTRLALRMGEVMNRPPAGPGYGVFERSMMAEANTGTEAAMEPEAASNNDGDTAGAMEPGGDSAAGAAMAGRFSTPANLAPRPQFAQTEAFLAELRARLAGEQAQLEQARAETRGLLHGMLAEYANARRALALLRDEVLPRSTLAFTTARAGYTAGATSFTDLIDTERMLLEARMEQLRARRDANQALLRLAMALGTLPAPAAGGSAP